MTLQFYVDGVEQGNFTIRLRDGIQSLPAAAHGGEISFAGVTIDDPSGTLTYTAWQEAWFVETACTGRERTWTGFIGIKNISRGPYVNGAGRIWDLTLVDQNAVFSFNPITGNDWNRPAETDIVRLAALVGSIYLPSSIIEENGAEDFTNNPIAFGEADYRHQYPLDVFTSVAGTSGKDFYAYYDHTGAATSLFYDLNATTLGTSTLRISNVAADYDGTTTFAPLADAVLTQSGENVYSNIDYQYRGGFVVDSRAQTITDFIQRGAIYSTDRVGRRDTAEALAAAFLLAHAAEQDEIAVSVRIPAAKVNLIEQGMGIDVKFSHLPGYTSFTTIKIISRNVVQYDDAWYDLHLVCSSKPLVAGPGGGDPGEFPHEPCGDAPAFVQSKSGSGTPISTSVTLDATPLAGNLLVAAVRFRSDTNTLDIDGFTAVDAYVEDNDGQKARLWYRFVQLGDSATVGGSAGNGTSEVGLWVAEFSGVGALDSFNSNVSASDFTGTFTLTAGTITATAGTPLLLVGMAIVGSNPNDPFVVVPNDSAVELFETTNAGAPAAWMGYRIVSVPSGSYSLSGSATMSAGIGHGQAGTAAAFICDDSSASPAPGQWVGIDPKETVTMSGNAGTTAFHFADGSLSVFVDDLDQTAAIVTQDGATGTFTLSFIPTTTEIVTVTYQARGGG